jgi:hypothetical protein
MSQFRRDEIKRCTNQMRDGLSFARKKAFEEGEAEDQEVVMQITAFVAPLIDLFAGIAQDLNVIRESLEPPMRIAEATQDRTKAELRKVD